MVFVALLGAVDVLCAISLAALVLGYPLPYLQAAAAFVLLGKSIVFIGDIISIIDIFVSIAMLLLLWFNAPVLALGLAVYLGLKGLVSFA